MRTKNREEWLDHLLNALPDHIFLLNEQGFYTDSFGGDYHSDSFDAKSYIGRHLKDVFSEQKAIELQGYIAHVIETQETLTVRYNIELHDHQLLPIEDIQQLDNPEDTWFEAIIKYVPSYGNDESLVMWSVRNVTEAYLLEQELKKLSETDELTGILNRRAFVHGLQKDIERATSKGTSLSCLMVDIDHFKEINDIVGHLAGDTVIEQVAQLCQSQIRANDYLGRLGGEEFGIVLVGTNAIQAYEVAERIRLVISETAYQVEEHAIRATVSIGVAELNPNVESVKALLVDADKAMYYSKRTGRDQVTIYHDNLPDLKIQSASKSQILRAC
ncbi:sensor domain-containing diguanylate cyclase [Vibrio maerlii]|uniref:sensor domain-containing diguanylate cyclase n=1 Tax=Vibrio maerlii TaxID=2231648 RepID=UPI000E3D5D98|nr:sensor domain-containing diguanylate cyclase [Vibrio maerlii]